MSDGRFNVVDQAGVLARLLNEMVAVLGQTLVVQGVDADDDAATANPVLAGGVYFADPTADTIDDGDAGYILLDDQRRVVVSIGGGGGASIDVQGIDADDDAITANPLVAGGVYYADPTADTIDDGDAGYLLINEQRMAVVSDRVYDSPTDANRNVPVFIAPDRWEAADFSGERDDSDATLSYYVDMRGFLRWSAQYIPGGDGTKTLTINFSDEDVDDPTTATYTDVTNQLFGTAGFTTTNWVEPELPTNLLWMRLDVAVSGLSGGDTATWDLFFKKAANS